MKAEVEMPMPIAPCDANATVAPCRPSLCSRSDHGHAARRQRQPNDRPIRRDAAWGGLYCWKPGGERASTGQRYARATARRKHAASATKANAKAGTAPGSGNGTQMHGSAENACVTMEPTTRPENATSAKCGSRKMPLPQCTHAPNARSTACAGRAKHCYKCGVAKAEDAFGAAAWMLCHIAPELSRGKMITEPRFRNGAVRALPKRSHFGVEHQHHAVQLQALSWSST